MVGRGKPCVVNGCWGVVKAVVDAEDAAVPVFTFV